MDGTSLQAIADEVGIKKPSILYHFESKDALRKEVLDGLLARWTEVVPRLIQASGQDGNARFEVLTREVVDFFSAEPDRARLLHRALMDHPEEMQAALRTHVRPWIRILSDHIETARHQGDVAESVDAPAYIIVFICSVVGTISTTASLGDAAIEAGASRDSLDRLLAELLRSARAALYRRPTPRS
jgi:AcrR family transcriptional regulator